MQLNLLFLELSHLPCDPLQDRFFHFRLLPGATYIDLFNELKACEEYTNFPLYASAIREWIEFQYDQQTDHSVFDTVLVPLDSPAQYAIFELREIPVLQVA